MKYNTNECLERMIRVIGEDHVKNIKKQVLRMMFMEKTH